MLVSSLIHRTAVDGTVFVTFTSKETILFTLNWCTHLRKAGVRTFLVGIMRKPLQRSVLEKLHKLGAKSFEASSRQSDANV